MSSMRLSVDVTCLQTMVRQNDPVCSDCAYSITLGKVRSCVRLRLQISPSDTLMVCLSGGQPSKNFDVPTLVAYDVPSIAIWIDFAY